MITTRTKNLSYFFKKLKLLNLEVFDRWMHKNAKLMHTYPLNCNGPLTYEAYMM